MRKMHSTFEKGSCMTHKTFIFTFMAIVFSVCVYYVYSSFLDLKKDLNIAQKQLTIKTYENSICSANLDKQNRAIESLRAEVKIDKAVKEKIEIIKTIKVKDETCEAKLFAYERLFDSSF